MVDISVIVACLNGARTLGEALESLVVQRADLRWEIVLADNGSTDATQAVFLDCAARHPGVAMRIVDASDRKGKSHALNLGIRAARGDRLLFLDDDDTVEPGWLAAMAAALERRPFVAARFDARRLNPDWAYQTRRHQQENGLTRIPHAPHCLHAGGATLGFHRDVFEAVGGFDPEFACLEDTDFCIRAHLKGFELTFVPEAVYNYRFRVEPEAIYRQSYNYARYRALLRRRYAADPSAGAPAAWLSAGVDLASLALGRAARAARRRPLTPVETARFNRRLGAMRGDIAGARAFGVAPLRREAGGVADQARRGWRKALLRAARPFCGALAAVRTDEKLIALTFDDGPDPETTPALLDLLAGRGAKATFFVIGERAARHPEIVARMAAEGHEIGNHTWDHPSLPHVTPAQAEAQLRRTRDQLAPHGRTLMRPPYGDQNLRSNRIARRLGYRVVLWNVSGGDWRGDDAETLAARLLAKVAPGAIVLLHDSLYTYEQEAFRDRAPTLGAVARLMERLPDYGFVTVSELCARGVPIETVALKTSSFAYLDDLGAAAEAPGPAPAAQPRRAG